MHSTLKQLPDAVTEARASIAESNAATNRDKLIVGLACFLAAMAGGLGVLYGKDPLNLAIEDQISFAAQHFWVMVIGDLSSSISTIMTLAVASRSSTKCFMTTVL